MKKNLLFWFFLIPLLVTGAPMNSKVLMLPPSYVMAFEVAARHREKEFPKEIYSAMIEESDAKIRVVFYIQASKMDFGGADRQIVYVISKKNYTIESVRQNLGK